MIAVDCSSMLNQEDVMARSTKTSIAGEGAMPMRLDRCRIGTIADGTLPEQSTEHPLSVHQSMADQ